jgi:3-oxoacid CoA-transferase subunit B
MGSNTMKQGLTRELIALRIAKDLQDGMYVNLGFGLPTMVSMFLSPDKDVILHAENGVLGYSGVILDESKGDIDLINASGQPTSLLPGASIFDLNTSFTMIRGSHIDVTVLGAYQVSEKGDLANWQISGYNIGGIGGAIELAMGAKRVIVAMEHVTKNGEPRIVKRCRYPLTARACVNTIVTDLAYIEVTEEGLLLREVAPGFMAGDVQSATEPRLIVSENLIEMQL